MWAVRFVILAMLVVMVGVFGYLLKNRKRYERVLEDRFINLGLVITYNVFCYLIVLLPSATNCIFLSVFSANPLVRFGFSMVGSILICSGIVLSVVTARQRKVLGGQDVQGGLMTSGTYRYFRHPICAGIVWVCLGLPLVTRNLDGLLMFPAVLGVNVAQAVVEERCDMRPRFRERYDAYSRTTRMFGPVWLWGIIAAFLLILLIGDLAIQ